MFDCKNIAHPFQNDPGCSQSQRVMDDLLNGSEKIDGRTLADLLNYFLSLSTHIKFPYIKTSNTGAETVVEESWKTFFNNNNLPFILAAAANNNSSTVGEKWNFYIDLFTKKPSTQALQLLIYFFYYTTIYKINKLYGSVKETGLPIVAVLEQLIKNKLQVQVIGFIKAAYSAQLLFNIRCIDFSPILTDETAVWKIDDSLNVSAGDTAINTINTGKLQQLMALKNAIDSSFANMLQAVDIVASAAAANVQLSLTGLKDDFQQKHSPHLALLFTFLNIFNKLLDNLNGYSKKHLDFFYQDVLQLKSKDAQPDKVHLVFELQKQLKQYALKKGLLVKGDKDKNDTEIDFAIDDDIVVNKTQVTDLRTLFVNNETIYTDAYLEGVYMAIKANSADGIDKDFVGDVTNYPTLGAKYSKYIAPGTKTPQVYPAARIGFVLASPVLLLNEGKRTITITLNCRLQNSCPSIFQDGDVNLIDPVKLFGAIKARMAEKYIYISSALISKAQKKGLKKEKVNVISSRFLKNNQTDQDSSSDTIDNDKDGATISKSEWDDFLKNKSGFETAEMEILLLIFKPFALFKPLKVLFSGEKDWIEAVGDDRDLELIVCPAKGNGTQMATTLLFTIHIITTITADRPAITFYNKDVLKEDYGTNQPLVKIELDDSIKISPIDRFLNIDKKCCLENEESTAGRQISLYHFFRNVVIDDSKIDVQVCGLKNFIVQNDESVQDVNGPVYPFGTRPKIDANFYIGSEEIFLKKWQDIRVNVNWKNLPDISILPEFKGTRFNEYYNGYQNVFNGIVDSNSVVTDEKFNINVAVLQDGRWIEWKNYIVDCKQATSDSLLFNKSTSTFCNDVYEPNDFPNSFQFNRTKDFIPILPYSSEKILFKNIKRFDVTTRQSFLRITLKCQDFQHNKYPFVLARQMLAQGKLPDFVAGAVYFNIDTNGHYTLLNLNDIFNTIINASTIEEKTYPEIETIQNITLKPLEPEPPGGEPRVVGVDANDIRAYENNDQKIKDIDAIINEDVEVVLVPENDNGGKKTYDTLSEAEKEVKIRLKSLSEKVSGSKNWGVIIPKEPWTPIISNMALDYTASADKTDITLIHLYPYKNTFKQEDLTLNPTLLPTYCDEGTLFIGLGDLVPGSNVNILFQLAEATSNTESKPQPVVWQYLYNNQWHDLRLGFEILNDATENLTTSGIINFAFPDNISNDDNTIMPNGKYWIKAAVPENSKAVCETLNIYTQAIEASFAINAANDTTRLSQPLKEKSVAKLKVADANIKQVTQPYSSFNGQEPEAAGHYYTRVSELLRHKGRAIQKFDYERLVLEAFPQVFKAKCINHSFFLSANQYTNDFPLAPGYVLLAVIPDLTKLAAGESFEPKVPEGIIEKIQAFLAARTSPFVKVKAVNPRFEKVNISLSVILNKGFDKTFYKEKLETEIRNFLAPWAVGVYDKLSFGECVNKSDLVYFLETRDYVDYITKLQLQSEFDENSALDTLSEICPRTPRSILLAGQIQILIEEEKDQEINWEPNPNQPPKVIGDCKQIKTIFF